MSYERGEGQILGVGVESTRNTKVAPQEFVRLREPADINVELEKADIMETRQTGVATQDAVLTSSMVKGTLTPNLRFETIGFFLKSLLGGVSSTTESGETVVYRHTFTLAQAVLQPTLTLARSRGSFQHKSIAGAVVDKVGLTFPLDDVINGTIGIQGLGEVNESDYTPAFGLNDFLAPHQNVSIKMAPTVAGLAGATGICVTDAEIEMNRNSRSKKCVSSIAPVGFFAKLLETTGKFTHEKSDDTYKDFAEANTPQAIQIDIVNTAEVIGVGSNPTLTIVIPKVTLMVTESRPLDDIITEDVMFKVHYDEAEQKSITIDLVNEREDYDPS